MSRLHRVSLSGLVLAAALGGVRPASAQAAAQEGALYINADVEKKLNKQVRVGLSPEVRTDGWNPDRYLLEAGVKYKPIDYFSVRGGFRADLEEKNSGIEHGYRLRGDLLGHLPFGDFEASLRFRYLYAFGPERNTKQTLRYQLGLEYSIPKSEFGLSAAAEAFQLLDTGELDKMRYSAGVSYKFYETKKVDQSVGLGYMLDYHLSEPLNVHIVELGYKILF